LEFISSRHKAISELVARCHEFEWDKGNVGKNWDSHNVSDSESEEIFYNAPLIFSDDLIHSENESRYIALGKTDRNRLISVVFTIRERKIRNISAHDMSRKDRKIYGKEET
jgi:uncharacterized DUF497 family protein